MKSTISLTVLVDNHAAQGLKSEHGFALLIECNHQRILFDTGQHDALFFNANKLNINLTNLDAIVLSHGHYDHGGNLIQLLDINPTCHLYLHPDSLQHRYSIGANGQHKAIGLSEATLAIINQLPAQRITKNRQSIEIAPSLFLTGEILRQQPLEKNSGPFYLDTQQKIADQLKDDQSLWITTPQGIVIVTGCCHAGIENTVKHIQSHSKELAIHTILGGLHLHNASEQRLNHTANFLKTLSLATLYPAHCSGEKAQKQLLGNLADDVTHRSLAGLKLTF